MAKTATTPAAPVPSKRSRSNAKPRPVHTALRLHPDVRRGLEALQQSVGGTLNSLMNEGLAEFVAMRTAAIETDMKAALLRLEAYRRKAPTFARDHLDIARDEVATRGGDPIEGRPYRVRRGPSQKVVAEILNRR